MIRPLLAHFVAVVRAMRPGRNTLTIRVTGDGQVIRGRRELVAPRSNARAFANAWRREKDAARKRELAARFVELHAVPGMSDQWLPFADRLRRLPDESLDRLSRDLVDAVESILAERGATP